MVKTNLPAWKHLFGNYEDSIEDFEKHRTKVWEQEKEWIEKHGSIEGMYEDEDDCPNDD